MNETLQETYQNPILPGFYPDPSICRVGGNFYLVTSSFHYFPGVPIFQSRDLIHWEQLGHCLTTDSQLSLEGCKSSLGIFAPTLRYIEGKFYMITTNMNGLRNFFVYSERPEGPWSEPVWLNWPGIDPSLFVDDDGRTYITGTGGFLKDEPLGIYQAEINLQSGDLLSERRLIWTGTGGKAPEGPHLFKKDGSYYLLIAEGGTEYGHMVTVARSDSPFGPYKSNPSNPILSHRSLDSSIQATGHADMVELADGSWWAVFLGIRPAPVMFAGHHHHLGRETFLAPVSWSIDGWPVIGDDGKVAETMNVGSLIVPDQSIDYTYKETFDSPQLDNGWNFLRNPSNESWSLTKQPGCLTLYGSEVNLDDAASPAFLGRRQRHFDCSVETMLHYQPQYEGEEAGLTVYMSEKFHYEIALTYLDGGRKLIFRRRVGSLWKVEHEVAYEYSTVKLGVKANASEYSFYYRTAAGEQVPFGAGECSLLSTEVAGGFTGVYIALYATGNGRKSMTPASFDSFEYIPHI